MKGLAAYRSNRVHSAPNEQLVVMLFETAIHRLQRAREAMNSNHRGARVEWLEDLGTVRSIYMELLAALDMEVAPELTRSLGATYAWVVRRLSEVGKTGDSAGVDGIIRVTDTLLGAFSHAVASVDGERELAAEAG